jgi:hypothetical protein
MSYIDDTKYAVENLILLLSEEQQNINKQNKKLVEIKARIIVYDRDLSTSELNEDFSEKYENFAHARSSEAHIAKQKLELEITRLQTPIDAKYLAVQALCGAILQIAKQGISVVHNGIDNCPNGRLLKEIPLKNIVWRARNQALHYEDTNIHSETQKLFKCLEGEFGSRFALSEHVGKSRAKEVIDLLEWHNYSQYSKDMKKLDLG